MIKHMIFTVAFIITCMNAHILAAEPYNKDTREVESVVNNETMLSPFSSTNEEIVSVKMIPEEPAVVPGDSFWVAFQFVISDSWHLYWKNPGDAGQGPAIKWMLPAGFRVTDVLWPSPERIVIEDSVVYGYSKQVYLLAHIVPPKSLEIGSNIDIKAEVTWYGCNTVCVPGSASFDLKLPVTQEKQPSTKQVASIFKQARISLPQDLRHTKARIQKDTLEIRVHQDMPFNNIKDAFFFLEQPDVLDPHQMPSWELSNDKKTLILRIKSDKLTKSSVLFPLKGVVTVDEESALGPLNSSWSVLVNQPKNGQPASNFEKKYQTSKDVQNQATNVDAHLEELENKIWYRRLLTEFSMFMKSEFVKILVWAFFGGILLNIMPCVLPVISFKLLHFVQLKGYSRMNVAKHGIMYSFGVLISFWILSGAIYILQSFGHVVGWGFQLQEPVFVTFLIIVLFILSLSLFGVFEFGVSLSSTTGAWEQSFAKRIPTASEEPSYTSSFASGVLATFVAAPCTGPLLGSAIGFAATLNPTSSFAIFSALGLGMAFPFLIISLFPNLTRFLPKPGRWMLTFKQLMGFMMLATVLWLVWVLDAQTMGLSNLMLLLSLFTIAFGVWIFGNWGGYDREKRTRVIGSVLALIFVIAGSWFFIANVQKARSNAQSIMQNAEKDQIDASQVVGMQWESFSLPKLQRYIQKGIPVFVDVTAKWCLTCQTNHLVLDSDKVKKAFIQYGVVKMKADWTMNDEGITRYMRSLGRNGVPVYAVYSSDPNLRPQVLPEVLTADMVIDALKKVHVENKN